VASAWAIISGLMRLRGHLRVAVSIVA